MSNGTRISDKFQIGKAGEHLVCADLFLKGLNVSIASETLPYDLLLDNGEKILKVQVKTTETHKKTNQWKGLNNAYVFSVKRKGSSGFKKYDYNEVDIFAVVSLDTKQIGYIKNSEMPTTINIRPDVFNGLYHDEKGIVTNEKILELKNNGKSVREIVEITKMSDSTVRSHLDDDYKPFKTKCPYMHDLQKEKEWFLNL